MNTFNQSFNHEFAEHIKVAKTKISAILAGERKAEHNTYLQAATGIAAESQRTSATAKDPEPLNRKERARYNQLVKPEEENALKRWAKEKGLWVEETAFNANYGQNYVDAGAEQKVYLKTDGKRVFKINTGRFHGTWLDFFIRLIIHQTIFPSTGYTLEGFTIEKEQFCSVVEQPWVTAKKGASKDEVGKMLLQLGFVNTKLNDYYNKEHGLILEDLHDENVFVGQEGNLLFVDPVIYFETPDLGLGGKNLFRFPFGKSF